MPHVRPTRRAILAGAAALAAISAAPVRAAAPDLRVVKDPTCGCCNAWVEIMQEAGFTVTTEDVSGPDLLRYKAAQGVPADMASCHTGLVEGYTIEGHVPPADVLRLLETRPDAVGLAVPGMPYGSPGMGPESQRDAYDVHLIKADGTTEVFASYDAAV